VLVPAKFLQANLIFVLYIKGVSLDLRTQFYKKNFLCT
jgi:hypothetical protein